MDVHRPSRRTARRGSAWTAMMRRFGGGSSSTSALSQPSPRRQCDILSHLRPVCVKCRCKHVVCSLEEPEESDRERLEPHLRSFTSLLRAKPNTHAHEAPPPWPPPTSLLTSKQREALEVRPTFYARKAAAAAALVAHSTAYSTAAAAVARTPGWRPRRSPHRTQRWP